MATVQITWDLGTGLGNIDSTVVHKELNGDCASLEALALAEDVASRVHIDTGSPPTDTSFIETNVGQGAWTYGVFAKNGAGVNACIVGESIATVTIP